MSPAQRKTRRGRDGELLGFRPVLRLSKILAWADAFRQRTGRWPGSESGPIPESPGDTWSAVDQALSGGWRGLPGGSSLAKLLVERRGARHNFAVPPLSEEQVLQWADAHFARTGSWPTASSGPIEGAPGETWKAVEMALCGKGARGLPGGSSLARLLEKRRGVRNIGGLPRLLRKQILAWAAAHRKRTGEWPTSQSGPIEEAPGETWLNVDAALRQNHRGLRGNSSLARLLQAAGKGRNPMDLPPLTENQVLRWAKAHHRRTGRWPGSKAGRIVGAPGETWKGVDTAMRCGTRGMPGGSSVSNLLAEHGLTRNHLDLPDLTYTQILRWADIHHAGTGEWPMTDSGPIRYTHGEKWSYVNAALKFGTRGMPGGSTLAKLLAACRGVMPRGGHRS